MKNLLFVSSSLAGDDSKSEHVARELIAALGRTRISERRLGDGSIAHLTGEYLAAIMTAPNNRTMRQHELAKRGDAYVEDVEAADVIVVAAPMYNFSIPSTLKAWIDHITRAGRTFRYTPDGRPEGLLKDKKVYVVASRGGIYSGDSPVKSMDFQEPYLRAMLAFIGLTDVSFVHVEGQRISPAAAEAGLNKALQTIAQITPLAQAA